VEIGPSREGVIIMTAHVIPEWKGSLEYYAMKIVDLLWSATIFLSLAFGVIVIAAFAFTFAINLHIINTPQQYCHYMAANQAMENFCQ
jgi:hypothetical protein